MKSILKIISFCFFLLVFSSCVKIEVDSDPYAEIYSVNQESYENYYGVVELNYKVYNTSYRHMSECSTVFALRLVDGTYKYTTAVDYDIDAWNHCTSIIYVDTEGKQCAGIDIISFQER